MIRGSFFVSLLLALVLMRSSSSGEVARRSDARSPKVGLDVALSDPIMPAQKKQTAFLKVGLTGFSLLNDSARPPVNIALVIDQSGSMQGNKIERAKEAAIAAIDRLRATDILSVVVYDQGVRVILPATKLTDKQTARDEIRKIRASGSTALFAGICKGAAEVRKFLNGQRVNRVILLSDGQANVGPASPSELGDFGASLLKEKISVTTLGLGLDYNEDLMTNVATRSNGNHQFIDNADELVDVFDREFDDVLSVVAQEVAIHLQVAEGIRPVRVLGHAADIHGQNVMVLLNQLYADQERFVLMEIEVPATKSGVIRDIAHVKVTYANMLTHNTDDLTATNTVRFSDNPQVCQDSRNLDVVEKSVLLIANQQNRRATRLRDEGKIDEARRLLLNNSAFLDFNADRLNSELLRWQLNLNQAQARNIDDANWKRTRKLMLRDNVAVEQQAPGYGGFGGGYGSGYGTASDGGKGAPKSQ